MEARALEPERVFLRRIRIPPPPLARAERQKVGARPRRDVGPQLDDEARRRRGADGDVEEGAGAGAGGRRGHGASEKERERERKISFFRRFLRSLPFFLLHFSSPAKERGCSAFFSTPREDFPLPPAQSFPSPALLQRMARRLAAGALQRYLSTSAGAAAAAEGKERGREDERKRA